MAGWALCMALVLAAVAGAVGETRYEKFLRQHVDHPQTSVRAAHRYCEIMLARRQVTAPGRPCKPSNTFVHAPAAELVAACTQVADAAGIRSTPTPMSLTACHLRRGNTRRQEDTRLREDTRPTCTYQVRQLHHHVRVACLDGLPVHLAGTHAPLQ
ncbi:ribonuclease CL2-like [Phoenicopterus ruber ruber]